MKEQSTKEYCPDCGQELSGCIHMRESCRFCGWKKTIRCTRCPDFTPRLVEEKDE